MKFLDKALLCGLILSLVILADARGDDPQLDGKNCRQSACQQGSVHCPILRAAECTARLSSAVDKAASSGDVILTVTPRFVIVEEEECLLGLAATEPDCCRGGDCCAAKSACRKSSCEAATGEQCEFTLKCGAKVAGKACCSDECQSACQQSGNCCEATAALGCKSGSCETVAEWMAAKSGKTVKACSTTKCEDGTAGRKANCGTECACAEKCACDKSVAAKSCCDDEDACDEAQCDAPPAKHLSRREIHERTKALVELMERLGPSVIEGTEFERVPSLTIPSTDALEQPVSIREELVNYIRCLASEETEEPGEVDPEVICSDSDGGDLVPGTPYERAAAVESLREAAVALEHAAALLERHNLYDASDRTRGLASELRHKGRNLQMFDTNPESSQTVPASCHQHPARDDVSKPVARPAYTFGGVEVQY